VLSPEDNALLTQSGPGSPLGGLMRRYWAPFLLSTELPQPDCPPVATTLLGESLTAFRDSEGHVGLRTSDGAEYPCRERTGIVWAYLGPPGLMPALPEYEFLMVPKDQRYITKRIQECNWLQALEGGLDSSHISFLHRGNYSAELDGIYNGDTAPRFFVVPADYGLLIAARRSAGSAYNWRNTPWLMPWYMLIPYPDGQVFGGHCWVPIDDHTCWNWTFSWRADRPLSDEEIAVFDSGAHIHSKLLPGTFQPEASRANDYLIDRQLQRSRKSFTGIFGSGPQDAAVQEGMGPIYDRSREHLGASDAGIIATRRHLLRAIRDDALILGLDPASHHVRAVDINLPLDVDGAYLPSSSAMAVSKA
jgi:phthalate 4,5-dioxygenase oxygenase subunit